MVSWATWLYLIFSHPKEDICYRRLSIATPSFDLCNCLSESNCMFLVHKRMRSSVYGRGSVQKLSHSPTHVDWSLRAPKSHKALIYHGSIIMNVYASVIAPVAKASVCLSVTVPEMIPFVFPVPVSWYWRVYFTSNKLALPVINLVGRQLMNIQTIHIIIITTKKQSRFTVFTRTGRVNLTLGCASVTT